MAITDAPKCQHKKENSKQCQRAALRRLRFCAFHQRQHKRNARKTAERARQRWFDSVKLNDQKSVQIALSQILNRLQSGEMDHKKASQLVYKLQMAIANRQR